MSAVKRPVAAWLAIVALALHALWPLIAQAKPRSVTLVPICTVAGETHYLQLETGKGDPPHEEHCQLCPMGSVALHAAAEVLLAAVNSSQEISGEEAGSAEKRFISHARPRAPPSFLFVGMTHDQQERKNAEAVALRHRGDRDAAAGRGIVRRGVLLG
jgi:hypothetical protein